MLKGKQLGIVLDPWNELEHFRPRGMTLTELNALPTADMRLAAMKAAGFTQVMLSARDVVGHPGGLGAAVAAVKAAGLVEGAGGGK